MKPKTGVGRFHAQTKAGQDMVDALAELYAEDIMNFEDSSAGKV